MAETEDVFCLTSNKTAIGDERELEPTERKCGVQFLPRESEQAEMDDFLQRLCPPTETQETWKFWSLASCRLRTAVS